MPLQGRWGGGQGDHTLVISYHEFKNISCISREHLEEHDVTEEELVEWYMESRDDETEEDFTMDLSVVQAIIKQLQLYPT